MLQARRLLHGLYVHSSGFLQMVADAFIDLPHRAELLKGVWTGFATLIERVTMEGAEEVGYQAVLTMATKEGNAKVEEMQVRRTHPLNTHP